MKYSVARIAPSEEESDDERAEALGPIISAYSMRIARRDHGVRSKSLSVCDGHDRRCEKTDPEQVPDQERLLDFILIG